MKFIFYVEWADCTEEERLVLLPHNIKVTGSITGGKW